MPTKPIPITPGQRFGRLTILREAQAAPYKKQDGVRSVRMVECQCDCGGTRVVELRNVTRGRTTSCGCAARENVIRTLEARHPQRLVGDVTLGEVCRTHGIKRETVKSRLRRGWGLERALGTAAAVKVPQRQS